MLNLARGWVSHQRRAPHCATGTISRYFFYRVPSTPLLLRFQISCLKFKKITLLLLFFDSTTKMGPTKRGVREDHPFKQLCNPKKKLEEGQDFNICFEFVGQVCVETCRDRLTAKKTTRTRQCLSILRENAARQAAVAKYMATFVSKQQYHHQSYHRIRFPRLG